MSSGWPPEEDGRRWEPVRHPSVVGAVHDSRDAARGYSGYAHYAPEDGANGGLEHGEYKAPGYGAPGYDGASGYDGMPGYDGADWNAPAPRSADGSGGYAVSHLDHHGEPANYEAASYDAGSYEPGGYEPGGYEAAGGYGAPAGANGYGENGYGQPAEGGYYGQPGYSVPGHDEPGPAQSGQGQSGEDEPGPGQAGQQDEHHGQQGYVNLSGAPVYEDAGYGTTGYDASLYAEPRYDDAGYQGHGYDGGGYSGQEFGGEEHPGYDAGAQRDYDAPGHDYDASGPDGYDAGHDGYEAGHDSYEAGGQYDAGGEAGYGAGGEAGYKAGGTAGYGQDQQPGYGQDQQAGYGDGQEQGYQDAGYGQADYAPGYGSGEYPASGDGYGQGFQHNAAYGRGGYVADGVGYADAGYAASYEPPGYDHRDYGDPRYDDPGYGDPGYEDAQYSGPGYQPADGAAPSYPGTGYDQAASGAPSGQVAASSYGAPVYAGEDYAAQAGSGHGENDAADGYGTGEFGSGGYGVLPGYGPGGPGGTGYDEDTDHGHGQQAGYGGDPGYAGHGYEAPDGTGFDAPGASGSGSGFGAEPGGAGFGTESGGAGFGTEPGQQAPAPGQSPDYVPAGFASDEFDGGGGMLGDVHGGLPDPAASGMLNTAGMLDSSGLADATAFSDRAGLPAGAGFLDASGPMRALGGTGVFDSSEFPVVGSRDGGNVTSVLESDVAELFGDAAPAETTSFDFPAGGPDEGGKLSRLTRSRTSRPAAKTAGRRRGRSGDRRLWIALGGVIAAAAVAIVAIILVGFKSGPGGPAHTLVTPNNLSSFVRRPALEQQMNVGQLRSDVVSMSSGQAKHVVEAVYENGTSTSGQTPQIVLFIGGNLANASPTASVKSFTQRFKGAQVTSPGKLGGEAACVNATASEPGSVAMCAWFDNDSFGEVVSPTMNASALGNTMRTIRPDVEKVVLKKQ